jgi:hypothetical protein
MLALSFSAFDPTATLAVHSGNGFDASLAPAGKANHGSKNERFCQSELGEAFLLISVCAPVVTTKFR